MADNRQGEDVPSMPQDKDLVLLRPPKTFNGRKLTLKEADGYSVQLSRDGMAHVPRRVAAILLRRDEGWRVSREPIPTDQFLRMKQRLAFLEERARELGIELAAAGETEGRLLVELDEMAADLIERKVGPEDLVELSDQLEFARMMRLQIARAIDMVKREHEQLSRSIASEERVREKQAGPPRGH